MLPHWSALAQEIVLVRPPSAAAEKVFSFLSRSLGDQHTNALQDYIETFIMVQCNKRLSQCWFHINGNFLKECLEVFAELLAHAYLCE